MKGNSHGGRGGGGWRRGTDAVEQICLLGFMWMISLRVFFSAAKPSCTVCDVDQVGHLHSRCHVCWKLQHMTTCAITHPDINNMRTHERDWKSAPPVFGVAVFATLYRSPCVYAVHLKAEADVYIPSQLIDSWEPCALSRSWPRCLLLVGTCYFGNFPTRYLLWSSLHWSGT